MSDKKYSNLHPEQIIKLKKALSIGTQNPINQKEKNKKLREKKYKEEKEKNQKKYKNKSH